MYLGTITSLTSASKLNWVRCQLFCKKPQKSSHLTQFVVAGVIWKHENQNITDNFVVFCCANNRHSLYTTALLSVATIFNSTDR